MGKDIAFNLIDRDPPGRGGVNSQRPRCCTTLRSWWLGPKVFSFRNAEGHTGDRHQIGGNTYHLSTRERLATVKTLHGLHQFMGWDGPILTISGGFSGILTAG